MAFSLYGLVAVFIELIRPLLPLVIAVVLLVAAIAVVLLFTRRGSWRRARRPALLLGLVAMFVAFLLGPTLTSAGFGDLTGALDWLSLIGGALAAGVVVALLAWPPIAALLSPSERMGTDR